MWVSLDHCRIVLVGIKAAARRAAARPSHRPPSGRAAWAPVPNGGGNRPARRTARAPHPPIARRSGAAPPPRGESFDWQAQPLRGPSGASHCAGPLALSGLNLARLHPDASGGGFKLQDDRDAPEESVAEVRPNLPVAVVQEKPKQTRLWRRKFRSSGRELHLHLHPLARSPDKWDDGDGEIR